MVETISLNLNVGVIITLLLEKVKLLKSTIGTEEIYIYIKIVSVLVLTSNDKEFFLIKR